MTLDNNWTAHPAADLFPMMSDGEIQELADDIAAHGQHQPVWLTPDGLVLDGRNRLRACQLAQVDPITEVYAGSDPVQFAVGLNLKRRHLNESQRAMIAARVANMAHGRPAKSGQLADLPQVTQSEAAEMVKVGERSVRRAKTVMDSGAPELVQAVETGNVSVSVAAEVAKELSPQEQADLIAADDEKAIMAAAKEIKARRRQERLAERAQRDAKLAEQVIDLTGLDKFSVLYVDPPWRYEHAVSTTREIENHYPTMSHAEICALQVPAADDAVLFMWVTNPKLAEGLEVLQAWGFDYRTNMVWVKDKIGMGYYARQRHELLLVARKGNGPVPDDDRRPDSVITAIRGRHSSKPDEVYDLIDAMYPNVPKVEMFARRHRDGWAAWGNQA